MHVSKFFSSLMVQLRKGWASESDLIRRKHYVDSIYLFTTSTISPALYYVGKRVIQRNPAANINILDKFYVYKLNVQSSKT